MKLPARTVVLSRDDWLVFDFDDGLYRLAYYCPHKPACASAERLPAARAEAIKPPQGVDVHGRDYARLTAKLPTLERCLEVVLGEADAVHGPATVHAYIRSTAWGARLP